MVSGRTVMSNYDPDTLSNEERIKLKKRAESTPASELSIDPPGFVGVQMPLHGDFQ